MNQSAPSLIATLKHDHVELRQIMEKIRIQGIGTPEGRQTLHSARALFIAHIRREDEEFYPAFRALLDRNPNHSGLVEQFSREMTDLGAQILAFFDKYQDGGAGLAFATDFGRMHALLHSRWHKEEGLLYARYVEMMGAA